MVYRCMLCSSVSESVSEAQIHYQVKHIDSEIMPVGNHEPNVIHNKEHSDRGEEFIEDDDIASESMCDVSLEIKPPQTFHSKFSGKPFTKRSSLVPQMSSVNFMAASALAKAKNIIIDKIIANAKYNKL
ncbi:hypothetical protein B4U80_10098 [Leptotrombidium deliense]|uniref:Uncharacterized protein n=1 Tax=Leptotrombidium deliense TaxID=299467 RepID=A0A443S893_9ACAR|nr:hypothetical protein B4U80_10098 [Leptotrombidium deliense]